jgi:CubicO group peptidase (beta-lactamase class C family)
MKKIVSLLFLIGLMIGCSPDKRSSSTTSPPYHSLYTVENPYEWETALPESQGLNPQIISDVLNEAESMAFMYSVLIVRNGFLVVEKYFHGPDSHDANHIHSVSKSFTSALIGIALRENYLESLDQKMMDFFPEYITPSLDQRKFDITLRHLLMMRAGFDWNDNEANWQEYASSPNWVKYAIEIPLRDNPGARFNYSTPQTNLLSAIITKASGMSTREFAERFLFEPLQISIGHWHQDPQGYYTGGHEMYYTPRDMARFGYLFLNNGLLDGNQIIPAEWVEESVQNYGYANENWRSFVANSGYGYQWWIDTIGNYNVFYASGKGGQKIMIIRDLNMVIVTTTNADSWQTSESQNQAVMVLIDHILDSAGSI